MFWKLFTNGECTAAGEDIDVGNALTKETWPKPSGGGGNEVNTSGEEGLCNNPCCGNDTWGGANTICGVDTLHILGALTEADNKLWRDGAGDCEGTGVEEKGLCLGNWPE